MGSTIEFDYPYLEAFYKNSDEPFVDIGITSQRESNFKFYPSFTDLNLITDNLQNSINSAKDFLPKALINEDNFLNWEEK